MNELAFNPALVKTETVHPGELRFAHAPAVFRTVLGSCIAVTVWHEALLVGGMCHYLMVSTKRAQHKRLSDYLCADNATSELTRLMEKHAPRKQYRVSIWGGSQLSNTEQCSRLSQQNIDFAQHWARQNHLTIRHIDVGGAYSRTLIFDLQDGSCYLKKFTTSGESIFYDN